MKTGEIAKFIVPGEYTKDAQLPIDIPPDSIILLEVELLDIRETFENDEKAVERANALNDSARVAFTEGRYEDAIADYQRVSLTIDGLRGTDVDGIRIRTERNLAVAFSKVQAWEASLAHANYVLSQEKNDLRALVRAVDALLKLEKLGEARAVLERGLRVSQKDPNLAQLKKQLEEMEKEERMRQNRQFAKMFSKK
jgi:tetratricopeptide (TPR) repeat protein